MSLERLEPLRRLCFDNITQELKSFLNGETSKIPSDYEKFMAIAMEASEFLGASPSKLSSEMSWVNSNRFEDTGRIVFSSERFRCHLMDWRLKNKI
ncbi:MAG: hypothetical protein F6J93_37660 [Oscillatoria sp. SIO1A7]|nr:hypothetical protein [Oscillatoria sp. SIO1A7]